MAKKLTVNCQKGLFLTVNRQRDSPLRRSYSSEVKANFILKIRKKSRNLYTPIRISSQNREI